MRFLLPAVLLSAFATATAATAAEIETRIEIPRLNVAEYHRPYVAVWLEKPDGTGPVTLAVKYDIKLKNNEGNKWLKDMRQWWRRVGRTLDMPVDGISGATLPVGAHTLAFPDTAHPLKGLPAGDYVFVVEAAREVGGRELLRVPVTWPPKAPVSETVTGSHELGKVTVELKP